LADSLTEFSRSREPFVGDVATSVVELLPTRVPTQFLTKMDIFYSDLAKRILERSLVELWVVSGEGDGPNIDHSLDIV